MDKRYVIGVDYGTDSCRVLVMDALEGRELAVSVKHYPRWAKSMYCDPAENRYRQHPLDYLETLAEAVNEALDTLPSSVREGVAGISFDMTCSTPVLVDENGTPLAMLSEFADNPNAMFILWKDHTAIAEADSINRLSRSWHTDYTRYLGGVYSSEWVWAKMMHVLKVDESVRRKAYSWIEHIDWIPALLTGNTKPEKVKRSRCSAGHKAMWHESWGGLPPQEFLTALSPHLAGFRARLFDESHTSDTCAGFLSPEWAGRLGLSTDIAVGVGAIDCHMGAVGAEIKHGTLVKVIGTSTCDIMSVPCSEVGERVIPGICGQVNGSVVPGTIGLEAGQSAFGDYYAWYKKLLLWPLETIIGNSELLDVETKAALSREVAEKMLDELTSEAMKVPAGESSVLANDWINGRRTPDADQSRMATITGLTLNASAPLLYRAIVEATAFGSKAIVERLRRNGIEIKEIAGVGGISLKSPFVMQTLSDVLGMPIKVLRSEQACALGAAMYASVVSGIHPTIEQAQKKMGQGFSREYAPDPGNSKIYGEIYAKYLNMDK